MLKIEKKYVLFQPVSNREMEISTFLLPHPNILEIFNINKERNLMIVEYCPYSLDSLLTKLDDISVLEYMKQMLNVSHIHKKNIYHGDIKTDNILIDEKGKIKIADFGESSFLETADEILARLIIKRSHKKVSIS